MYFLVSQFSTLLLEHIHTKEIFGMFYKLIRKLHHPLRSVVILIDDVSLEVHRSYEMYRLKGPL